MSRVTPAVDFQKSLLYTWSLPPSTAMIKRPNTTVATAAQRNHHSARHVSLSSALLRAAGSISAYAGTCTKLKNHRSPIHMIATMTCEMRNAPQSPSRVKISSVDPAIGSPQSVRKPAERTKVWSLRQGNACTGHEATEPPLTHSQAL